MIIRIEGCYEFEDFEVVVEKVDDNAWRVKVDERVAPIFIIQEEPDEPGCKEALGRRSKKRRL